MSVSSRHYRSSPPNSTADRHESSRLIVSPRKSQAAASKDRDRFRAVDRSPPYCGGRLRFPGRIHDNEDEMKKFVYACVGVVLCLAPAAASPQNTTETGQQNSSQASPSPYCSNELLGPGESC